MKLSFKLLVLSLYTGSIVASTWFSKAAYNKWHETELERWISDNDIPYPTPADRKDLENLVEENWQSKIASPYKDWNAHQLASFLKQKGIETAETAAANKDSLTALVKDCWYETEEKAEEGWANVKNWIFDSWTDSQLKAFADKHNIPVPQPRNRDSLLQKIRSNFEYVAKEVGETVSYPGDWLYEAWSESDLKEYLDSHGITAPQPTTRDKLIASVRRNSRLESLKMADMAASASASANAAAKALSDQLLEAWSDSQIKEWCGKNGIKVPQGSRRNELIAIARKHHNLFTMESDQASESGAASKSSASASSAFGAATSKAGNRYAKATDDAQLKARDIFNTAISSWSDSRLKAFLDARGIPVPQSGEKGKLIEAVRLNSHKAASSGTAWAYDTWTFDNLRSYLLSLGDDVARGAANKAGATRDDLVKAAQSYYLQASKSGGATYASVTSYLVKQTDATKDLAFDAWSDSEVKAYLDTYGVPVPQGSTQNELRAYARNQANYFRYGTTTPQGTLWAKFSEGAQWVTDQLRSAIAGRRQTFSEAEKVAGAKGSSASEKAQKAAHHAKEEL